MEKREKKISKDEESKEWEVNQTRKKTKEV